MRRRRHAAGAWVRRRDHPDPNGASPDFSRLERLHVGGVVAAANELHFDIRSEWTLLSRFFDLPAIPKGIAQGL